VSEEDYGSVTDLATIVDTALVKAYVKTKHADLTALLSLPNRCHIKVHTTHTHSLSTESSHPYPVHASVGGWR
jgi:hypothetical protein